MQVEDILTKSPGDKLFLLGNEAIVRGAFEAGVKIATTYPGTPSSEIGNTLFLLAKKCGIYFEFSVNEMVAFQIAAAAAATGVRAMTFMKHVGLNVAADALMSAAYTGTKGGFLIITADDPSMFSSQNEQDNRYYALFAGLPLLEPSNLEETKEMVKYALDLSEDLKLPVILRTTTRINHIRSGVTLGEIKMTPDKTSFIKNPSELVPIPSYAYQMHSRLIEKLKIAREFSEICHFNRIEKNSGESHAGVITSGVAYSYVKDAIDRLGLEIDILKLGFSIPLPEQLVNSFIEEHPIILVIEELEPILEKEVRVLIQKGNLKSSVLGKINGLTSRLYEFTPDLVEEALSKALNIKKMKPDAINISGLSLPPRPPVLCAGCPHRATFYEIKEAIREKKLKDVIFPSDIGCYTLGIQPPYQMVDYLLCMGSSVGTAGGFYRSTNQKVISFIGDSTFFHAGIPPLLNAVHNKHQFLLFILDNLTTAMTGHQPHPGSYMDGMGQEAPAVSLEEIVQGVGVKWLKVIDPYQVKESISVIKEALDYEGIAVIIARHACSLLDAKEKKKKGFWKTVTVNQDLCIKCMICINDFTCPAMTLSGDEVKIETSLCDGCGVCLDVCPDGAIKMGEK